MERVYYEISPSSQPDTHHNRTKQKDRLKLYHHGTCRSEKYVLFLKTHKTGSSTITNILNRYADKNNLTILAPKSLEFYSFDWPNKFRLGSAANTYTRPNILANHARYSRKSMNVLFPRESTMYLSILRHPVSQFESTFQYMSFPYILGIANLVDPLDFFLDNPPSLSDIQDIARKYPSLYLIRNPLFFDLGLDHRYYGNSTFIRRALKTLDEDFDLVLIMEYFDESLTLLRRRLCWDIDDVVHFKLNERLNKNKRRILTERQIQKIKVWNNADMVLYNYFLEKFWQEINNEGPGFYDEVAELRKRREHYKTVCIEKEAIEEAYSSVYVKGYQMRTNLTGETKQFCERLLRNELKYMDYFRKKSSKWIKTMEGTTIQNFESSKDEVDIFFESPDIQYTNFKYESYRNPSKKTKAGVTLKPLHINDLGPPRENEIKNDSKQKTIIGNKITSFDGINKTPPGKDNVFSNVDNNDDIKEISSTTENEIEFSDVAMRTPTDSLARNKEMKTREEKNLSSLNLSDAHARLTDYGGVLPDKKYDGKSIYYQRVHDE